MQKWYQNLTKNQKKLIYAICAILPITIIGPLGPSSLPLAPILYIPLLILIFLQFGSTNEE